MDGFIMLWKAVIQPIIAHIGYEIVEYIHEYCGIQLILHNIVMDMNTVVLWNNP